MMIKQPMYQLGRVKRLSGFVFGYNPELNTQVEDVVFISVFGRRFRVVSQSDNLEIRDVAALMDIRDGMEEIR